MALPAGSVTFCFTDIEGSTQLFAKLGPRFLDLLEDHRRIIRSAVAAHGGSEVKTEGDGFFLAFADPSAAVRACIDFQRALAASDGGVKVRVGLHVGDATPIDDDYMVYAVHEAARIGAAPHGGQIIVSDTLAASLPDGFELIDLGSHELKDIGSVRLHQVCGEGLERDFPPLRTAGSPRGYVPVAATDLIGREEDVDALRGHLATTRLVTITGAGGAGKTRLAIELGRDLLGTMRDGVWFVDLAPVTDATRVDDAILDALGVMREEGTAPLTLLLSHLAARQAMLIIDNCEHVIDAVSTSVQAILNACADVRVLATSREALGLAGEQGWRLRSLDTSDGSSLFEARARLVDAAFELEDHRADVHRIVERLDGIPLAIELAAARTRVLTPSQIAERLDDRFRLLTGGSRTALARQRTLEATVDWSYDLLDEAERRALRAISVFVGGFELDAAEAVAGNDLLDTIDRLVDKSMVVATLRRDTIRYRLLETIRHYAWTKLVDAQEASAARDAHLAYYTDLAVRVTDGVLDRRENEATATIEPEHDNLRAALDWATSDAMATRALALAAHLWTYWAVAGRTEEGLELMQPLMESIDDEPDVELRIRVLTGFAHLLWIGSRSNEVMVAYAERATALARQAGRGPRWYDAWASMLEAVTGAAEQNDLNLVNHAVDTARAAGDEARFVLAHALLMKGRTLRESLRNDEAREALDEGLAVALACGSTSTVGELLERKSFLEGALGNVDDARRLAEEAVAASERGPNEYFRMFALFALHNARCLQRDPGAAKTAERALAIATDHGLRYQASLAWNELGWHSFETGNVSGAADRFRRSIDIARQIGFDRPSVAFLAATAHEGLTWCHDRSGRPDDGLALAERSRAIAERFGHRWPISRARNNVGWLLQSRGRIDEAERAHLAALDAVIGVRPGEADALAARQARGASLCGIAAVSAARGENTRAATTLGAAAECPQPNLASPRISLSLVEDLVAHLRQAMGDADFETAFAAGRALGTDAVSAELVPSR